MRKMPMSYVFSLVVSNSLALVCFLLVVFYSIHMNRDSMLRISMFMMILTIVAYVFIGRFGAVVSTLFTTLRNYVCLKHPNRKEAAIVKILILLVGTVFSAWCAWFRGGNWEDYLPAVSFLFCTCGYFFTESAGALRIINASDSILFWLVYDYLNIMVFNVLTDLFVVLFPLAERYVSMDKTDSPTFM